MCGVAPVGVFAPGTEAFTFERNAFLAIDRAGGVHLVMDAVFASWPSVRTALADLLLGELASGARPEKSEGE